MAETRDGTESFAAAADLPQPTLWQEFRVFLVEQRMWWMAPILAALALVGGLTLLAGTGFAPFVYSLW